MKRPPAPVFSWLLVALVGAGLLGCSGGDPPPKSKPVPQAAAEPEPETTSDSSGSSGTSGGSGGSGSRLSTEERLDPANRGSVRGVVRFEGEAPTRNVIPAPGKTPGCVHHETPPLSEIVIVNDGKLENVFLYIRKKGLPRAFEIPEPTSETVELDQKGCIYVPHVQGMQVGQTLEVKNSDKLAHNVNCRANRNASMNPTQGEGSAPIPWKPTKKEVMVKFECNIHSWMWCYVGVLEHPFFAVTGADGSFAIEGLPPGEYTLEAWHEKLGKQSHEIRVPAAGAAEIDLVFKP